MNTVSVADIVKSMDIHSFKDVLMDTHGRMDKMSFGWIFESGILAFVRRCNINIWHVHLSFKPKEEQ